MNKSIRLPILLILGIIVLMIVVSKYAPKSVDWRPTYNTKDKIPLGMYVLDHEIDSFFHTYIERIDYSLTDYFYEGIFEDEELYNYNLLYINDDVRWNDHEVINVCRLVGEGNSAFISTSKLPPSLIDSLGIMVNSRSYFPGMEAYADSITIGLYTKDGTTSVDIRDNKGITGSYLSYTDSTTSTTLGYLLKDGEKLINFTKIKYGNGYFFIHLEPAVFTNYFLLKQNDYQYAEYALSQIDHRFDIIWSLNNQTSKVISDSPLRFILSQPALRWAWYLLLAGLLLFVIFNIRREQRAIKSIPQPTNSSVEFAKTIGNLYFLEGDVRVVMDKKIVYLLERIRTDFHIDTEKLDERFVHLLALKSSVEETVIKKMVFLINKHLDTDYNCTSNDLIRLNTAIENFYTKS